MKSARKHKPRQTLGEQHFSFWRTTIRDDTYYVYLIRGPKKTPVKIGKALNPITRLKTLQTGNPHRLRLLHVVPTVSEPQALLVEKVLHLRFDHCRLPDSEWFYGAGVSEIIEFVERLAKDTVRNYRTGSFVAPPVAQWDGWTYIESEALKSIHRAQALGDSLRALVPADEEDPRERARREMAERSFVPTLGQQYAGTRLRANNRGNRYGQGSKGPCSQ